jgi:hypothetical protein
MKKQFALFAAGILVMISGCSTPTALQVPVGPTPMVAKNTDPDGMLKVFSATEQENNVGFEFPYNQRTDYYIYDSNGNEITRVSDNNKGEFEATPRPIQLNPGTYRVKALAAVGMGEWITVPVVIESGRTTEVHLNGHWKPPVDTPENQLVHAPAGFPMGWRADVSPTS